MIFNPTFDSRIISSEKCYPSIIFIQSSTFAGNHPEHENALHTVFNQSFTFSLIKLVIFAI